MLENFYEQLVDSYHKHNSLYKAVKETYGEDADIFSALIVAQYARFDGRVYPDYSREANGCLNPEGTCSVMADLRNDTAIRRCSEIMSDAFNSAYINGAIADNGLEIMSAENLRRSPKAFTGGVYDMIRRIVTHMHRTTQQQLVSAAIKILKEASMLPESVVSYLPLI